MTYVVDISDLEGQQMQLKNTHETPVYNIQILCNIAHAMLISESYSLCLKHV